MLVLVRYVRARDEAMLVQRMCYLPRTTYAEVVYVGVAWLPPTGGYLQPAGAPN